MFDITWEDYNGKQWIKYNNIHCIEAAMEIFDEQFANNSFWFDCLFHIRKDKEIVKTILVEKNV